MEPNDEIDALRQEVATLRGRLDQLEPASPDHDRAAVTRRGLLMGLAGASAAAVAGVAGAEPAAADDGDLLMLGAANTASTTTQLTSPVNSGIAGSVLRVTSPQITAIEATSTVHGTTVLATNEGEGSAIRAETDTQATPSIIGYNSGTSAGLGGASLGGGPQLYLMPDVADGVNPIGPATAYPFTGAIRVDANGDVWLCTYGSWEVPPPPDPPRWTRLAREDTGRGLVFPIAPTRVLDTRETGGRPSGSPAVPGQKKGPLKGGAGVTLDLAALAAIPDDAQAVIGNLTVTAPTANGYLKAVPSGSSSNVSALNWARGATVANAFTCQLGPAGLTLLASGTASQSYELIVDITAYVA